MAARIAADVATAIFRVAHGDWTGSRDQRTLAETVNTLLVIHRTVTFDALADSRA